MPLRSSVEVARTALTKPGKTEVLDVLAVVHEASISERGEN
jgi:hypothetical protein